MKLIILLMLVLVAVVAHAQRPTQPTERPDCDGDEVNCPDEPRGHNCRDLPDGGRRGPNCQERAGRRWYYNSRGRRCQTLQYLGCGGNGNRYYNRRDCEQFCVRRGSGGGGSGTGSSGSI